MDQGEKVSVIIPVYNVEKYLCRCIESILKQTYQNLEIILVDDGSSDRCPQICDEYSAKDERIIVCHEINKGVAAARNMALELSTGQYLTFVDGDDFIAPDYIECLYHILKLAAVDISLCGSRNIEEDNSDNLSVWKTGEAEKIDASGILFFQRKEALRALMYQIPFDASPWGKMFKKELFDSIRFPEGCWYEDFAVMPRVFERAERFAFYPYDGYGYVQRKQSTTLEEFSDKKMQLIEVAEANERFISERYPELLPAVYSRVVRANLHIYSQIPLNLQYRNYRKQVRKNVRRRRRRVLMDRCARKGTKAALCLTYAGFWTIRVFRRMKFLGKK